MYNRLSRCKRLGVSALSVFDAIIVFGEAEESISYKNHLQIKYNKQNSSHWDKT